MQIDAVLDGRVFIRWSRGYWLGSPPGRKPESGSSFLGISNFYQRPGLRFPPERRLFEEEKGSS